MEFEEHSNITIQDLRELDVAPEIDDHGFEVFTHESKFMLFDHADAAEQVKKYKLETEELLKERLGAVYAICYDHRLRKNVPYHRKQYDLKDPLLREGPAQGVHNGELHDRKLAECETDYVIQTSLTTLVPRLSTATSLMIARRNICNQAIASASSSEFYRVAQPTSC